MEKRLADIDELRKDIVERGTQLSGCCSAGIARYMDRVLAHVLDAVDNAPAVDAVPRWIPCEERLPEIGEGFCSKDVIVALDDGGIAFTCLEATLFGSVCWQIERMNEIEDGKEINVIAWMPLPEPYGGEREDDEMHKNG